MSFGRYQPPRAPVGTTNGINDEALSDRPRRPLAVTLFLVLLAVICASSLLKSVRLGAWIMGRGGDWHLGGNMWQLVWAVVCLIGTAGVFGAIYYSKPFARYFGWIVFAVLIGFAHIDVSEGAPPEYAATPAMRGGYEAASGLWEILLVIWAVRFGLGAKAKLYFEDRTRIPRQ